MKRKNYDFDGQELYPIALFRQNDMEVWYLALKTLDQAGIDAVHVGSLGLIEISVSADANVSKAIALLREIPEIRQNVVSWF